MQIQTTNVHTPRTVREAIPRAENLQQSATWYYSSTIPTTKYDSSTTVYYNVLFQYYSVLQGPTKYAPSTTLYYKVLAGTTPALVCTTKYYSSTTLYDTVIHSTPRRSRESSLAPLALKANALSSRQIFWAEQI